MQLFAMTGPQSPALIDSHVHTDDKRFASDIDAVLRDARAANVIAQIIPSTARSKWPDVRELCAQNADLFPCYGLHPCFSEHHSEDDIEELAVWLGREKPVALGECGLDYHNSGAEKSFQQKLFAAQLALAREFNLPVVIHANKAVEDIIRMIRASGHYRGMVHSFNGSTQQAARLIDLGYRLSFGGAITYQRAKRLRTLVSQLPLDALMLETDAPDQPDATHWKQRNEPAYLRDVWQSVSSLRSESPAEIAHATCTNAIELFRLPLRVDDQAFLQA